MGVKSFQVKGRPGFAESERKKSGATGASGAKGD